VHLTHVKTTKGSNFLLKNYNYLLKSYIFNLKYANSNINLYFGLLGLHMIEKLLIKNTGVC